ncbi:hypothetical protein Dimus_020239 [Dionaea muscipula]
MAKRELSSTLRNLKFMQRATQKEEKPKEEEEERKPDGNFLSPGIVLNKKCIVIVEGDPRPASAKGRMSFRNFNPAIDKLNDEAANSDNPDASATSSSHTRERTFEREDRPSDNATDSLDVSSPGKRKQPEVVPETVHPKLQKNVEGDPQSSSNESRSLSKKPKREKLDWNVLRPPKGQSNKG